MIVTKEQLKALTPCTDGYEYWLRVNKPDLAEFMIKAWEDDHSDWANWLFVRVVPRELYLKYAIYSAELVIDIYEKRYPNNKRPRNAIQAAKKVLEDDSVEHRKAAAYAAAAAADAADAERRKTKWKIIDYGINILREYERDKRHFMNYLISLEQQGYSAQSLEKILEPIRLKLEESE